MANKDFQNGFIVGLASKGKTSQKTVQASAGISQVILPVTLETVTTEITDSNIEIETSVALEESGE